jgi:hypothetical protein
MVLAVRWGDVMTATTSPESEHRRGLVLGLTLAEILLLLLFMLLLAFGAQVKHLKRNLETGEERYRTLEATVIELAPLAVELRRNGLPKSETIQEIVLRLGTVRNLEEHVRDLESRNRELNDTVSLLSSVNAAIRGFEDVLKGASRIDPSDPPGLLKRALEVMEHSGSGQSNLAANVSVLDKTLIRAASLDRQSPPDVLERGLTILEHFGKDSKPEELKARVDSALAAEKMIGTVREEGERYRRERDNLMRSGRGSTFPSCWITDRGETEYIFDVSIRDTGVVVKDMSPAYRRSDQSWKLLDAFARDTEIPETRFRNATAKLYNWSHEKDCRFFVTMRDQTGPTSKDRYKSLRNLVEQHFYVRQVEHSPSPPPPTALRREALPMGGPFIPVPAR